jgi:CelD/BcsL family acetyltransferase involved in cellulose biosynthesis
MSTSINTTNGELRTGVKEGEIHLYVFNNFDDVYSIQAAWDNAIEKTGSDIFLSFDWCRIWWKYYGEGKKLELLLFKRENVIVGIIPLYLDRIRVGPFLIGVWKIVGCDFTLNTFCLPIEKDWIQQIVMMFLNYFERKTSWDMIFLGPISGFYPHTRAIQSAFKDNVKKSMKIISHKCGVQSIIHPRRAWDEYLRQLGQHTRRNIRNTYKLLFKEGQDLALSFAAKDSFEEMYHNFVSMHQSKWEKENRAGFFGSWPRALEFHHELALSQLEKRRLFFMEVLAGTRSIGFDYSYRMGSLQSDLLSSRLVDPETKGIDTGKIIWCEVVKKAIIDNIATIDFMRGTYEYKKNLGVTYLPIEDICITTACWWPQMRIGLLFFTSHCISFFYSRLWRNKVAPLLSLRPKEFWISWIRTHWFGERMK